MIEGILLFLSGINVIGFIALAMRLERIEGKLNEHTKD